MRGFLFVVILLCYSFILSAGCIQGNCQNGQGTFVYENGDKYVGHFIQGHPEGRGIMYFAGGGKYLGQWRSGKPHGRGKLIHSSGDVYFGQFENGEKQGQGRIDYADGRRYEGPWVHDRPSGQGKEKPNAPSSRDELSETKTDATNEHRSVLSEASTVKDCNKTYCDNEVGQYIYKDGSKWVGHFIKGRPSGQGTCYYSNGDRYTGGWKLNAPQGEGVMYYASGKIAGAIWQRGRPVQSLQKKETFHTLNNIRPKRDRAVKIWAVVIGVSAYTHMPVLRYSDDDAYRIYAFLKSPEGGALPESQIKILIDEDATRANILNTLQETFLQADENDMVLLYYSGHGLKGAFIPIDYDGYHNSISHEEIFSVFDRSKAKYKVCYADACYSGSMTAMKAVDIQTDLHRYYHQLEDTRKGLAFLLSSKGEEYSLEDKGLRQGVFTHFLIRGLKGEADTDQDKLVTINELYRFVRWGVRKYTGNMQTPVIIGDYDKHMPLSLMR